LEKPRHPRTTSDGRDVSRGEGDYPKKAFEFQGVILLIHNDERYMQVHRPEPAQKRQPRKQKPDRQAIAGAGDAQVNIKTARPPRVRKVNREYRKTRNPADARNSLIKGALGSLARSPIKNSSGGT
jgi:hypothetical protein